MRSRRQPGLLLEGEQLGPADAPAADHRRVCRGLGGDLLSESRVFRGEVEEGQHGFPQLQARPRGRAQDHRERQPRSTRQQATPTRSTTTRSSNPTQDQQRRSTRARSNTAHNCINPARPCPGWVTKVPRTLLVPRRGGVSVIVFRTFPDVLHVRSLSSVAGGSRCRRWRANTPACGAPRNVRLLLADKVPDKDLDKVPEISPSGEGDSEGNSRGQPGPAAWISVTAVGR